MAIGRSSVTSLVSMQRLTISEPSPNHPRDAPVPVATEDAEIIAEIAAAEQAAAEAAASAAAFGSSRSSQLEGVDPGRVSETAAYTLAAGIATILGLLRRRDRRGEMPESEFQKLDPRVQELLQEKFPVTRLQWPAPTPPVPTSHSWIVFYAGLGLKPRWRQMDGPPLVAAWRLGDGLPVIPYFDAGRKGQLDQHDLPTHAYAEWWMSSHPLAEMMVMLLIRSRFWKRQGQHQSLGKLCDVASRAIAAFFHDHQAVAWQRADKGLEGASSWAWARRVSDALKKALTHCGSGVVAGAPGGALLVAEDGALQWARAQDDDDMATMIVSAPGQPVVVPMGGRLDLLRAMALEHEKRGPTVHAVHAYMNGEQKAYYAKLMRAITCAAPIPVGNQLRTAIYQKVHSYRTVALDMEEMAKALRAAASHRNQTAGSELEQMAAGMEQRAQQLRALALPGAEWVGPVREFDQQLNPARRSERRAK